MRALVVTTVHAADDTRMRERLVASLSSELHVRYATRAPGPSDRSGLDWVPLTGGRARRWWRAFRMLRATGWDVAVICDPELVPAAVMARLWRRRPIVFDVHEDLAAQIVAKAWIPRFARPLFRGLARLIYSVAEKSLRLTLAEDGYRRLFRGDHPVFPNYPTYRGWPDASREADGSVVYVGDVRRARGLTDAAEAARLAGASFLVVGPAPPELAQELAAANAVLVGRRPNREALKLAARASVGISPLRDLPNYRESLPTKVIEYLALGLSVVATDLPGTRRVVEGWDSVWLVPPGDIEAMSEAIRLGALEESREAAWSRSAAVRARYVWPHGEFLDWYRSLTGEQEPGPPGEVHDG